MHKGSSSGEGVHFLRRGEREGEESRIPREIELGGKRAATRRIGMHP
jgi:hypothetical protein